MLSFTKRFTENHFFLFLLLVIASVIRFWNFSEIPLMYDELSGLLRAQAESVSDVINETKQTDVHPIGMPVFIHYWTIFWGNSEQALKFPFIIFSLCSIFFTYKIAEKWFNPTVGLITTAFMASLQFTTMYGQLARPYASGMFFSVLLVWFFVLFFDPEKSKKQNIYLLGFIISATLCAYNHYFSLLFAGIVGLSGFLFINKQNALKYILSSVFVFLLYIPQLPVFLHHFSIGGGSENDWLKAPEPDWIWIFIKYLFHYSRFVYAIVIVVFIGSFFYLNKAKKIINKHRLALLIWGVVPFLIAYFYSVYKSPVLQFSTMTFSIPFLLLFIFSFYKEVNTYTKTILLLSILSVNIYTLIFTRKHFNLFYKQEFEQMALMSISAKNEFGSENVSIAHKISPKFMDYYFKKYNTTFSFYSADNTDTKAFKYYLDTLQSNYFVAGCLPLNFIPLVKEKYPYLLKKQEGFTSNIYCFSKTQNPNQLYENVVFESINNFEKADAYWIAETIIPQMDSIREYGPTFKSKLKDITKGKHNILNVSTTIDFIDSTANPVLVIDITDNKGLTIWRGGEKNWYANSKKMDTIYTSQLISEINLDKHPDAEIKIYIWNQNKKTFRINNITIKTIDSNPYVYGLYEPL